MWAKLMYGTTFSSARLARTGVILSIYLAINMGLAAIVDKGRSDDEHEAACRGNSAGWARQLSLVKVYGQIEDR